MPHAVTASPALRAFAAAANATAPKASTANAAASSASTSSTGGKSTTTAADPLNPGGAMGKTQFLQLLVAQMKNQDPLNPMDGTQMASQLAQFSTVEQLQNANDTLTQIAGAVRVANGASGSGTGSGTGSATGSTNGSTAGSSTGSSAGSSTDPGSTAGAGSSGAVANGA